MPVVSAPTRSLASVDPLSPVDWRAPLNRGRQLWLLGVPGRAGGGAVRELCGNRLVQLNNMDPASDWVATGRGDLALDFDGSNDYLSISNPPAAVLSPGTGVTVSAWVKPNMDPTSDAIFVTDIGSSYKVLLYATSYYDFSFYVRTSSVKNTSPYTPSAYATEWYMLTGVYDGSYLRFYCNGAEVVSPVAQSGSVAAASNAYVGTQYNGPSNGFRGRIADLSVWDRGLSAVEVRRLYAEARAGFPRTLRRRLRWFPSRAAPSGVGRARILGGGLAW